ncbi:MAG: DUF362 domain-containing protein [Desulfuromonadales bacterium]|nr:DUF362 domain-containing protein [Desulfuromonadales bacterium]
MKDKISVAYVDTYEYERLRGAVLALLEPLGGISAFVGPGERVLLKPNMLAARAPALAVTTHPSLVRVVAELVREAGATVLVGDSPGIDGFQRVAERSGIGRAAREGGAQLVPFDDVVELSGSGTFRRIELARVYWEADKIINLPKLKTHEMMTMTCAVKNLFGAVVGTEKAGWHLKAGTSRQQFAQLMLEIYLLKKPTLNIVDAIVAMEGDGPGSGAPVNLNALIAGVNPVAVDLIAARLAGIPPELLHIEREAERMGLDGVHREEVDVVGAALEMFGSNTFRLPKGLDVQFGLPGFLKKGLRRHLTARPVAHKQRCVLCGICRDTCPPQVITIQNSALSIDEGRCIRCWCCRELCPKDAMEVRRGVLMKLLTMLRERRSR